MMKTLKTSVAAAALIAAGVASSAEALPMAGANTFADSAQSSNVLQVREHGGRSGGYHGSRHGHGGHWRGGHWGHGGWGWAVAGAFAPLILSGIASCGCGGCCN